MAITLNSPNSITTNIDTGHALLTAKKVQNQQELEGQMAVQLIQSAGLDSSALPTAGNSGHNINIKV
ncbi:cytoplasmic protein [Colwelliaceae bacterium 6441]